VIDAAAPARPAETVQADPDGTTIARAAIGAALPDRGVAPHGPEAKAAGPPVASDRISAAANPANAVRHLPRWWRSTSACAPKKRALNRWLGRSR
jgi:hypothetical protein